MKLLDRLLAPPFARRAVQLVKVFCYLVIGFDVLCLALSCLGRQSFQLFTSEGAYEHAIYAEADHAAPSRSMTVSMDDDAYVHANSQGQVELPTQLALTLMLAVKVVPAVAAYGLLLRVLTSIQRGEIFTEANAGRLLGFGLLQGGAALLSPFLRQLLCALANLLAESQVAVSTGAGMLDGLAVGCAFAVAASIIHYGIGLQDEVDHTL